MYVMERYELTFTMIIGIFQIHQQIPHKRMLLLDDCFVGKQNKAEAVYSRGRHNNCDTIYIAQNYFRLPRYTVRENSNLIILFPQDVKNLTHIHAEHYASDIYPSWNSNSCVTEYITIDLTSTPNEWKVPPEFQPILFSYSYYIKLSYSYCQSSWKNSGQSSWKRSRIISLQHNYYRTKKCCMMKLRKSGMRSVIRTK